MVATSSSVDVNVVPVPSEDSVEVYRTTTGTPKRPRTSATMDAVMRAAPVPATLSDRRSDPASASLASMRAHCVGTPCATVTCSSAMTRMASSARHGVGVMMVVTALPISSQALVM